MRTVHIQPLTHEAFAPFGQFYPMEQPQGYALCGELHRFFPDRISADSQHRVGFSPILVKKPERMIVTQQEYHTTTWEMILPKHTLVKLNAAVWHLAPLPAHVDELAAMIILPECTYANDCTVVDLTPEQQFEIVR